jgi:hypothetical protein
MVNFQAFFIGIDRYHFFQHLHYAEANAQKFYQFLVEEAKIPAQQTLLSTDTSPWFRYRATYPDRENLIDWFKMKTGVPGVQPLQNPPIWFFFSGYAIQHRGEDYLLPIDGSLKDIPRTAIAVRWLFESLQQETSQPIFAIFDLNHLSPNDKGLRKQTLALAKQKQISLIVSSQPPNMGSSNGSFVDAVLEALRYYRHNITLAKLEQYLDDRLPEFSLDGSKPLNPPIIVSPNLESSALLLLPHRQEKVLEKISVVRTAINLRTVARHEKPTSTLKTVPYSKTAANTSQEKATPLTTESDALEQSFRQHQEKPTPPTKALALPQLPQTPIFVTLPEMPRAVRSPSKSRVFQTMIRFKWFFGGLATSLVLSAIAFFLLVTNNRQVVQITEDATLDYLTKCQLGEPVGGGLFCTPVKILDPTLKKEQDILNRARISLKANQASDFIRAISMARQLTPNTPIYQDAQIDIDRWSQTILDIAEGRARTGNFPGAIEAARLVPPDLVQDRQVARQKIELWQDLQLKQDANQALIDAARRAIDPTDATSYSNAIAFLRQIPPLQPNYWKAREFMNFWSQKIYFLALDSAAEGDYQQAIATAQLISDDMLLYKDAQKAIARWEEGDKNKS